MLFIDFIPEGADMCPLLRIAGFDPAATRELMEQFQPLESKTLPSINICEISRVKTTLERPVIAEWDDSDSGARQAAVG